MNSFSASMVQDVNWDHLKSLMAQSGKALHSEEARGRIRRSNERIEDRMRSKGKLWGVSKVRNKRTEQGRRGLCRTEKDPRDTISRNKKCCEKRRRKGKEGRVEKGQDERNVTTEELRKDRFPFLLQSLFFSCCDF